MKILIISQYFWPETFRINDLAKSLHKNGHDITVLTGLPNYPSGKLFKGYNWFSTGKSEYEGITLCRVPLLSRGQGKSWQLALNYISFVFFSCLLGPLLCREKYDVIFVFEPSPFTVGLPGVLFRFLKGAPMLFWVQDLWPESIVSTNAIRSKYLISLIGNMVRYIYKRCDRVLIQSRGFEKPAIHAGAKPEKIIYFPNWAEDFYKNVNENKKNSISKELPAGFRIMFAGNLGTAQSLETIVNAANYTRENKDICWLIIGDGRRYDWLKKQIKDNKLEDTIYLLGRKPVESMPAYFKAADVLLVTLKQDMIFDLTIPSKIQSYLASGKPIAGSLNGEGAKIIHEARSGFAVSAGDARALADVVLKMYALPGDELARMGQNGLDYNNQHFNREQLIGKLEKIMQEVKEEMKCAS